MSLEAKIEALTEAINRAVALFPQNSAAVPAMTATVPQPMPAPAPTPAPVQQAAPAPAMPPLPNFMAQPQAAPAPAAGAPFTDGKGLVEYVMGAYKTLGPEKGAQIQTILVGLGYDNINNVKPEHYPALFQGVEALKGA